MASISKEPNGHRRILFVAPDESRRTVRLGKIDQRSAETICRHVEALLVSKITGQPVGRETAVWLAEIGAPLRKKLARVGLIESMEIAQPKRLAELVDGYLSQKSMKERTRLRWSHSRNSLVEFFGTDRPINSITAGEVRDYEEWLQTAAARKGRSGDKTLADGLRESTLRKRLADAKQVFGYALDHEWIARNPFTAIRSTSPANRTRDFFITPDMAHQVLDACPSTDWKLIFGLARFGGLRIPSEIRGMTWGDINWEKRTILVRSSKTGDRIIPLFGELRPLLEQAWEEAPAGAVSIFERPIDGSANLRTHLHRIIVRAGLMPWQKTFHNLRASRATELHQRHPAHVVNKWLGHTELVAQQHYLQTTAEDFEKAAHFPAQYMHEIVRKERKSDTSNLEVPSILPQNSHPCDLMPVHSYPRLDANTPKNSTKSKAFSQRGAESGAVGAPVDADLSRIITIWERLPATVRAGIIAMIDRAEERARTS